MPSSIREVQKQTPRPPPLKIAKESCKVKKPIVVATYRQSPPSDHRSPIIVHMHSPKIVHARPQDFMRVVQLLTGNSSSPSAPGSIHPMLDLNEGWETDRRSRLNPSDSVREFRFYSA
ncbi:putative protein MKS1 [Cocos nucifera]|nr:putative protein MKS1 [Cocos nucifera]